MTQLLICAPRLKIDFVHEGPILLIKAAQGVMTMTACLDTLSVLRAESTFEPTTAVVVDLRRTVWAMSRDELGEFGGMMHHQPLRQRVAIVLPPGAISLNLRSAYVRFMAEYGQERAFFEDLSAAALWASGRESS